MQRDYSPYGEVVTAAGNDETAYQFSGKEKDLATGFGYFGARYYYPGIGRWLVPDPAGQGWSPYAYCMNSPVIMVDEDGEWAFLIPILVSTAINVGTNWDNIHDPGDFFGYAGVGALQGAASLVPGVGPALGGIVGGVGNAYLGGARSGALVDAGVIGGISGFAGGAAGKFAAKNLGGVVINGFYVASPMAKGFVGGVIGGAAGGYVGSFTGGYLMTGDLSMANQAGLNGMYSGGAIGGASGIASGYRYAKANGLNPLTGKPNQSITIGRNQKIVDATAKSLDSKTIKDWPYNLDYESSTGPQRVGNNIAWMQSNIDNKVWIYNTGQANMNFSVYYNGAELGTINHLNYNKVYNVTNYKGLSFYR